MVEFTPDVLGSVARSAPHAFTQGAIAQMVDPCIAGMGRFHRYLPRRLTPAEGVRGEWGLEVPSRSVRSSPNFSGVATKSYGP